MKTTLLIVLAIAAGCGRGEPARVKLTFTAPAEEVVIDPGHAWLVSPRRLDLALDHDGAERFARASAAHLGERVTVVADERPIGSLTLRAPIRDGRLSITLAPDDSGDLVRELASRLAAR
jgi:hypothetical protein